MSPAPVSGGGV